MGRLAAILCLVTSLLVGSRAEGSIWNAVADFDNQTNPTGAWSYGWVNGNSFQADTDSLTSASLGKLWRGDLDIIHCPLIRKNINNLIYGNPESELSLHPGPGGQACVVRWTAPSGISSVVTVKGQFFPGDHGIMQVGVFVNGLPQSTLPIWSGVDSGSFNFIAPVSAGETIDFAVFGGYDFGTTPLDATISGELSSAVPEPSSMAVCFGLGSIGIGAYVWGNKRRTAS